MQYPFKKLKHQPSLPSTRSTAPSVRSKVVAQVDRLPINRQAALAIRQKRCWLEEPPAEKPRTVPLEEYNRACAQLKIERNQTAQLADELGVLRAAVRDLRLELASKTQEISRVRSDYQQLQEEFRQLEDLKL